MESKKKIPLRKMILCSFLIAAQIVLARFVGIQINEGLRISFETIPMILGSIWLGPLWGMVIAVLSDILGTIVSGYGVYFPLLTVGPVLLTLIIGLTGSHITDIDAESKQSLLIFILSVIGAEVLNTLYCTWALTLYYSIILGKEMPFKVLFAARAVTKPVTILVDTVLSYLLHKSLFKPVVSKYLTQAAQVSNKGEN